MKPDRQTTAKLIAAACCVAAPLVASFEGKVNRTYLDPVRIPTACFGHTGPDVVLGQVRTDGECSALLDTDLRKHTEGVAQCTPEIAESPEMFGAATSLAFNIGVNNYCASTAARRFHAGNYRGGCEALGWFTRAGGKTLPGLVRRRQAEVQLCMKGAA